MEKHLLNIRNINTSLYRAICERGNERLYIQVALRLDSQAMVDREFGNLLAIRDNYPKIVVSEDRFNGNTYQGIRHMQIRDFMLGRDGNVFPLCPK